MRTLVVYESMYGNTRAIAEAIAHGVGAIGEVNVVPAAESTPDVVAAVDFVIAGGPTHAHGMSRASSRENARAMADKPDSVVTLEPEATGPGMREFLETLALVSDKRAAAFDTRVKGPELLTGRASSGIAKGLRGHGYTLVAEPESFLVDTHNRLVDGEAERAATWAANLAASLVPVG